VDHLPSVPPGSELTPHYLLHLPWRPRGLVGAESCFRVVREPRPMTASRCLVDRGAAVWL
jgi:hypothetical protein